MALLSPDGNGIILAAKSDAIVLFLSGEPINEPIVGQGPFVMNTGEEIAMAIQDYRSGHFGQISN